MQRCPNCTTPLDPEGRCVTCEAAGEGFVPLARLDYATIREMMGLLEEAGFTPEMERVPPSNEREVIQPRWNLYVPKDQAEAAVQRLGKDWKDLLSDEGAAEAAQRGAAGVDLDAGGEITCPACGHTFTPADPSAACPDCGLVLGAPE